MQTLGDLIRQLSFHNIIYLVSPSSADRPTGFTAATTAPATTTWSSASTAWTAQVTKVDLQLGRDVIGWLPEVVLILYLNYKSRGEKLIKIFCMFTAFSHFVNKYHLSSDTVQQWRFYLDLFNLRVNQITFLIL